jgi:hypothetical protein
MKLQCSSDQDLSKSKRYKPTFDMMISLYKNCVIHLSICSMKMSIFTLCQSIIYQDKIIELK